MAFLYISEYQKMGYSGNTIAQTAAGLPVAEQRISIGAGSVQSAPTNAATTMIQLNSDSVCSIAFGTVASPPTAVATAHRMSANETRVYVVPPGTIVAAITNT